MNRFKGKLREHPHLYKCAVIPYGIVRRFKLWLMGNRIYRTNRKKYRELNKNNTDFPVIKKYEYPCLYDRFEKAAVLGCYFWQDLWAAQLVHTNSPTVHYDIGSRVDGFIAHLSGFGQETVLIDVRPLPELIPHVRFIQDDATSLLQFQDESVESISALCSIEHFGLGRYGDEVDPDAWRKALKSVVRVLKPGGDAYISVPIGNERVEFDAHRIFFASTVVETCKPLELRELSAIYERDHTIEKDIDVHKYDHDMEAGDVRFGLFHFRKPLTEKE